MKAMILASGLGTRLSPYTDNLPKAMVDVSGRSILERQLDSLMEENIKDVIITTGPFEETISALISKEKYSSLTIKLVKNEVYDTTNYIYSMYKCIDLITDDFLLLHGDLVFDQSVLNRLIKFSGNAALVNKEVPLPEKDFKADIINGRIQKIGLDCFTNTSYFLAPLYKFNKDDFTLWMNRISDYVAKDDTSCYAENALNEIFDLINLKPLYYSDEFCMEIDTVEDLKIAEKYFLDN